MKKIVLLVMVLTLLLSVSVQATFLDDVRSGSTGFTIYDDHKTLIDFFLFFTLFLVIAWISLRGIGGDDNRNPAIALAVVIALSFAIAAMVAGLSPSFLAPFMAYIMLFLGGLLLFWIIIWIFGIDTTRGRLIALLIAALIAGLIFLLYMLFSGGFDIDGLEREGAAARDDVAGEAGFFEKLIAKLKGLFGGLDKEGAEAREEPAAEGTFICTYFGWLPFIDCEKTEGTPDTKKDDKDAKPEDDAEPEDDDDSDVKGLGEDCTSREQCEDGLDCVGGRCELPSEEEEEEEEIQPAARKDVEEGGECVFNRNCQDGLKCIREECVRQEFCEERDDCEYNEKCIDNHCVSEKFCEENSDCRDDQQCSGSVCVEKEETVESPTAPIDMDDDGFSPWWLLGVLPVGAGGYLLQRRRSRNKRRRSPDHFSQHLQAFEELTNPDEAFGESINQFENYNSAFPPEGGEEEEGKWVHRKTNAWPPKNDLKWQEKERERKEREGGQQ